MTKKQYYLIFTFSMPIIINFTPNYMAMKYIIDTHSMQLEPLIERIYFIEEKYFDEEISIDELEDKFYNLLSCYYEPGEKTLIQKKIATIPLFFIVKKFKKKELSLKEAIEQIKDWFIGNNKKEISISRDYKEYISYLGSCLGGEYNQELFEALKEETIDDILTKQYNNQFIKKN
jgi:hypothetical protein